MVKEAVIEKEEVKKTTRKRRSKKEITPFSLNEMMKWTDEECKAKDKELKFKVADVRDILKSTVDLKEQLDLVTSNLNLLKSVISRGLFDGYRVTCPNCKENKIVSSMDLNRKEEVTCSNCGTKYKENENISGISYISEENTVTEI